MTDNFGATKHPVARKEHRCEECGRWIMRGERYSRHAGAWEGDFFTWVSCAHCEAFRKLIDSFDDGYYEVYYGGASDWVANSVWREMPYGASDPPIALLRAVAGFGMRWRTKTGTLLPVPTVSL